MKQLLTDTIPFKFKITEGSQKTLPNGRLYVEGKAQHCGVTNRNNRRYPLETTFGRIIKEGSAFMERVQAGEVFGHIEHPEDGRSHLGKAAIKIEKVWMNGDECHLGLSTLSTPLGKTATALFEDGLTVGISSRGQGSIQRAEDGVDEVQEDFDLETWDLVADPSTPGAKFEATESVVAKRIIEGYIEESRLGHKCCGKDCGSTGKCLKEEKETLTEEAPIEEPLEEVELTPRTVRGKPRDWSEADKQKVLDLYTSFSLRDLRKRQDIVAAQRKTAFQAVQNHPQAQEIMRGKASSIESEALEDLHVIDALLTQAVDKVAFGESDGTVKEEPIKEGLVGAQFKFPTEQAAVEFFASVQGMGFEDDAAQDGNVVTIFGFDKIFSSNKRELEQLARREGGTRIESVEEAKKPKGKIQNQLMTFLAKLPAGVPIEISDIKSAKGYGFERVDLGRMVKAAEALTKADLVDFDGSKITLKMDVEGMEEGKVEEDKFQDAGKAIEGGLRTPPFRAVGQAYDRFTQDLADAQSDLKGLKRAAVGDTESVTLILPLAERLQDLSKASGTAGELIRRRMGEAVEEDILQELGTKRGQTVPGGRVQVRVIFDQADKEMVLGSLTATPDRMRNIGLDRIGDTFVSISGAAWRLVQFADAMRSAPGAANPIVSVFESKKAMQEGRVKDLFTDLMIARDEMDALETGEVGLVRGKLVFGANIPRGVQTITISGVDTDDDLMDKLSGVLESVQKKDDEDDDRVPLTEWDDAGRWPFIRFHFQPEQGDMVLSDLRAKNANEGGLNVKLARKARVKPETVAIVADASGVLKGILADGFKADDKVVKYLRSIGIRHDQEGLPEESATKKDDEDDDRARLTEWDDAGRWPYIRFRFNPEEGEKVLSDLRSRNANEGGLNIKLAQKARVKPEYVALVGNAKGTLMGILADGFKADDKVVKYLRTIGIRHDEEGFPESATRKDALTEQPTVALKPLKSIREIKRTYNQSIVYGDDDQRIAVYNESEDQWDWFDFDFGEGGYVLVESTKTIDFRQVRPIRRESVEPLITEATKKLIDRMRERIQRQQEGLEDREKEIATLKELNQAMDDHARRKTLSGRQDDLLTAYPQLNKALHLLNKAETVEELDRTARELLYFLQEDPQPKEVKPEESSKKTETPPGSVRLNESPGQGATDEHPSLTEEAGDPLSRLAAHHRHTR